MKRCKKLWDIQEVQRTLRRLSYEILEKNADLDALCIVGIAGESHQTAQMLHSNVCAVCGRAIPYFEVEVQADGSHPLVELPCMRDKTLVLAVDVLFSGDTIRRALGAVCSAGRPRSVQLAALVDRGHRRFPIRANYVGKNIPTALNERISVQLSPQSEEAGVYILEEEELPKVQL